MAEFWDFVNAVRRKGSETVAGVLVTVVGLLWATLAVFFPELDKWQVRPWMVFAAGVGLLFAAAFQAWRDEKRAKDKAETDLARLRDQGIELRCSEIKFSWGQDPDIEDGVLVVLDVDRLVNGTDRDVVLDIKLVAPVWRGGGLTVTTSSRAVLSPVTKIKSTLPQLPPLINLSRKQGKGPGYFVFFFAYKSWQNFVFVPRERRTGTLDEFANLIVESELQVEMVDCANNVYVPPVPAPGTIDKKARRMKNERSQTDKNSESA